LSIDGHSLNADRANPSTRACPQRSKAGRSAYSNPALCHGTPATPATPTIPLLSPASSPLTSPSSHWH
jgi:hypothetical protein